MAYKKSIAGAVSSINNRTGAIVLDKADVGLESVDNTTDMDKPVSNPQNQALDVIRNDVNYIRTNYSKFLTFQTMVTEPLAADSEIYIGTIPQDMLVLDAVFFSSNWSTSETGNIQIKRRVHAEWSDILVPSIPTGGPWRASLTPEFILQPMINGWDIYATVTSDITSTDWQQITCVLFYTDYSAPSR
jgi:hypothetical protein